MKRRPIPCPLGGECDDDQRCTSAWPEKGLAAYCYEQDQLAKEAEEKELQEIEQYLRRKAFEARLPPHLRPPKPVTKI